MSHPDLPSDDSLESDAVWKLLDEVTPAYPRTSFADDVVRMAKLEPDPRPWWRSARVLFPSMGLAAAAAVTLVSVVVSSNPQPGANPALVKAATPQDDLAELQDFAETEALIAAADHLDEFSDQELAGLIGF